MKTSVIDKKFKVMQRLHRLLQSEDDETVERLRISTGM